MSSLLHTVKDSPRQLQKKMGKESYNLANAGDDDPFSNGITFRVTYLGSGYHPTGIGDGCTTEVVHDVWRQTEQLKNVGRKMSMVITDKSLKLKDVSTKALIDDIPLHRVSYCGTDRRYRTIFAFIAKETDTGKMKVHVTKADNEKKVQAMCMTLKQAFSIAFKAWQYKTRKAAKDTSPHTSPKLAHPKISAAKEANKPSPTLRARMADLKPPSLAPASAIPVLAPPPASPSDLKVLRVPTKQSGPSHDSPLISTERNTGLAKNKDGFLLDDEFSALARARSNPDLLDTNEDAEFDMNTVRQQADPGSLEYLLDI